MATIARAQAERAEVEAVLRSGIFHRAPMVASFFRYVCERYFEGEADKVKEYNIGVEALGRPATFDQKKDSIVRVEAHRLRKLLSEYYASEGANHAVEITVPPGQYVPRFLVKGSASLGEEARATGGAVEPTIAVTESEIIPSSRMLASLAPGHSGLIRELPVRSRRPARFVWFSLVFLCLVAVASYVVLFQSHRPFAPRQEVWRGSWEPVEGELRFLAGSRGGPFHDRQGRAWQADRYYDGGVSLIVPPGRAYDALPDPAFVHSFRQGTFRYDIPLVPGTYELRLYFIETQFGDGNPGGGPVNARTFRINLNGKPLLESFDALSEAGAPNRLHTRVFRDVSPAEDGKLHLAFQPMNDAPAFLSALELLPTSPGHVRPIRIVSQRNNVVDAEGALWQADQYAVGGTQVDRTTFANEPERMLYQGERYGNFSYHIPVADGRYRVRLHFAETYFGTKLPWARNNSAGPRIFNVFANGVALLRNFDIANEAGGPNKPIVKVFENLEPNAQGMIVLEFIPVHNYAEVNAIEVVQMD
jgi:Malectin domain